MLTSYRIVELVRKHISNTYVRASDTEVAKALGVSRAAISAWKSGRDIMSHELLITAAGLAKLDQAQLWELFFALEIERAKESPAQQDFWRGIRQATRAWGEIAAQAARSKASAVALAMLAAGSAAGLVAPAPANAAESVQLRLDSQHTPVCIMRSRRRDRRRRRSRLLRAIRWTGAPSRAWRRIRPIPLRLAA